MTLIFKDLQHDEYERVLLSQDESLGFECITAIHNTNRGPSLGGCRYFSYQTYEDQLTDVLKLSKAMTYKNSLANLDFGGGKATVNAKIPKDQFYELFAQVLKNLDGTYITAGDIGMVDEDLVALKKLSPYVCSTKGSDSGLSTAYGVFNAMIGYEEFQNHQSTLENKKILIKGYGKVGSRLAQFCKQSGASVEIVDFESKKDLIEKDGFVFLKSYQDTNFDQIDIFSPCATGGDLNQEFLNFSNNKKVNCVLGAANNQLAENDIEQKLFEEGITYCPDYCVNAGGVIILALRSSLKENMEYDEPEAKKKLIGIKEQLKNKLLFYQNKKQLITNSSNEIDEQELQK